MEEKYIDEVPADLFTNLHQIGSGSFSDIFSATHIKTNVKVALKITLKEQNEENLAVLRQEVSINKILFHPFICKFFQEIETQHLHIIVMEIIEGISALDYVNETSGIPIAEARNLFTQLLIAIEYLHNEAHITHRDLKLENIMIDYYGHIRLIDFGFSSMKTLMTTCCGTIPYCAPEVLSCESYSKESDIWSLGIILYAFLDGNLPFYHSNINTLVELIVETEVYYPENIEGAALDLLKKILIKDPSKRISIDGIKVHPFVCQEKILQINYKQLFTYQSKPNSSILKFYNSNDKPQPIKCFKHTGNLAICATLTTPLRKPPNVRPVNVNANLFKPKSPESLQERILLKTDNVDLLIESRKDFAENLNKLIDLAFVKLSNQAMKIVNSCDVIPDIRLSNHIPLPKKDFEFSLDYIHLPSLSSTKKRRASSGHETYQNKPPKIPQKQNLQASNECFSDVCEDENNIADEEQILL